MEDTDDIDKCLHRLNGQKPLRCPACGQGLVRCGESIDQHVDIVIPPIEGIIRLSHKECTRKKNRRKRTKMLSLCLVCNHRTNESVQKLVKRYCKCKRTPTEKAALDRSNTTELTPENIATNVTSNDGGSVLWNDNDGGLYQPDGGTAISIEESNMDDGGGDAPGNDGDTIDLCNNGKDVEGVSSRLQAQFTCPELEARRVFANESEFSEQSGDFLTREFIKKGDGCRAMVYQALIDNRRLSHFDDLEDKEVDYHLHVAALHYGMPQKKSMDVCAMTTRMDLRRDQERETELSVQSAAFIESIKRHFPDDTHLVENMLGEVNTAMTNFRREECKKRRATQSPCYNTIRSAYRDGPNSILNSLPVPEVNILHECAHVPANQSLNHLLAFNKDVHCHRVGFDEDWLDSQGNYQCQYFQEVHGRVKAMMEADPQNVTKETRVVFV